MGLARNCSLEARKGQFAQHSETMLEHLMQCALVMRSDYDKSHVPCEACVNPANDFKNVQSRIATECSPTNKRKLLHEPATAERLIITGAFEYGGKRMRVSLPISRKRRDCAENQNNVENQSNAENQSNSDRHQRVKRCHVQQRPHDKSGSKRRLDFSAEPDFPVAISAQLDISVVQPDISVVQPDISVVQPDISVVQPDISVVQPDIYANSKLKRAKHGRHVMKRPQAMEEESCTIKRARTKRHLNTPWVTPLRSTNIGTVEIRHTLKRAREESVLTDAHM